MIKRKIVGKIDILDVVEQGPSGKLYHVIKLRFDNEEFYVTEIDRLLQKVRSKFGDFVEEVHEGEAQ